MSRNFDNRPGSVVPAQLSFLTIYNPCLGNTDETLHDQIVFYFSKHKNQSRRARRSGGQNAEDGEAKEEEVEEHEERNERLRQIGLAQGMVEFARSFSDGEAVDSVETEKSRIVLHELERGWWILASIDLTRLPLNAISASKTTKTTGESGGAVEYSSREVSPPALLLQQLLRAHSIFLLHHAPSLDDLYVRLSRAKFCSALSRFWMTFIRNWDVLLHGNPAVDIFRGMKLAPGGELGIGVGEEEWGSGEREMLEGFVERVDGMVDLVVSRFGEPPINGEPVRQYTDNTTRDSSSTVVNQTWAKPEARPGPSDGVIFSGVKAVTRESVRALTNWMEWLYLYGGAAYGVQDNPSSALLKRPRKLAATLSDRRGPRSEANAGKPQKYSQRAVSWHGTNNVGPANATEVAPPGIPPPIVSAAEASLKQATDAAVKTQDVVGGKATQSQGDEEANAVSSSGETFIRYLTFGYGSQWGFNSSKSPVDQRTGEEGKEDDDRNGGKHQQEGDKRPSDKTAKSQSNLVAKGSYTQHLQDALGGFLIGLKGDLETDDLTDDEVMTSKESDQELESRKLSSRISVRTVHVEMEDMKRVKNGEAEPGSTSADGEQNSLNGRHRKLRVVVYTCQPFIFTFLFELRAPTLAISSFYRSIHHQLQPLQRPLLASTSPSNVSERMSSVGTNIGGAAKNGSGPIFDLIYDPKSLTVHSSIPNIPNLGSVSSGTSSSQPDNKRAWSRVEALNVHTQILSTLTATRGQNLDVERTCKTSRGWWIVWMRLPASHATGGGGAVGLGQPAHGPGSAEEYRQAFLVRKASDRESSKPGTSSWRDRSGFGATGSSSNNNNNSSSSWAPGKLAEGIGVDTRKYIEGLLSLSR
ncbi:MAG: hypothetical protein M1837_004753 [Sclerophora amabilis]|nr:MAG: hypothetical protein M1837_004753 [Sclerophora amabilis]